MGPGKLWEDLGSTTFVTIKNDAEGTMPSTRNAKRRELERKMNESSDDELDFLSSSSRSDDVEQPIPTKRKPRLKKKQPEKAVIQGREADYHPDGLPKRKLPDFKKVINTVQEGSSSTSRSKTSSTTQKALMQTRSYGMLATLHDNENGRLSWPSDGLSSDEDSSVDRTHSSIQVSSQREIQKFPGLRLSPLRVGSQDSPHKPRDCTKGPNSFEQPKPLHSKTSPSSSGTNNRSTLTSCRASRIQYSDSSSETTPRAKHPKNRLRKFPILDPLSISDQVTLEMVGGSGPSPTRRSTLSDTTTPRKNCKSRYPFPSPLSSPAHQTSQNSATALRGTDRQGTLDVMADEDADDECQERRLQPRPFPMAASQSNATHRTPCRNNACTERAWPDNGRNSTFLSDAEVFGDDPLFIGESTDPSSLCPFCDEKLPPNPSPFYLSLLEAARRKARLDPRPSNPHGLKAQMGVYVASCKRHRFEAHQIPEAIAKGWPTDINFGQVRERVERLTGGLTKLVRDEGNAREESVYWTAVMTEVRKLGSRAASGVKGQFESFEKTQPGYYGELGSMILHQTLYNMFPPSSFDPQSITPLTPQEFIQRILVPEAALTLIMEDTGQDRVKALQTMRESAGYGVAMFPDTSEGPEVGAGEDIVLERARARRRELEDEERIEAILCPGASEDECPVQTKGTKRPKTSIVSSATTTDIEEIATTRRKMKRKKARSHTDAESGPDGHVFRGPRTMGAYKANTAVYPNAAAHPPQAVPSLLPPSIPQANLKPQGPWTSSPEQNPAHTKPESQDFTPKPKSTLSNLHDDSRCGFASAAIKPGATPTARNSQTKQDGRSMSAPIDVDDPQIIDGADVFERQPSIPADRMVPSVQGSSDIQELGGYRDLPNPRPKPRRRIVERNSSNDPVSRLTDQDQRCDSSVEIIEPPPSYDSPARRNPTHSRTSRPRYDRHDWLMNDSSD